MDACFSAGAVEDSTDIEGAVSTKLIRKQRSSCEGYARIGVLALSELILLLRGPHGIHTQCYRNGSIK